MRIHDRFIDLCIFTHSFLLILPRQKVCANSYYAFWMSDAKIILVRIMISIFCHYYSFCRWRNFYFIAGFPSLQSCCTVASHNISFWEQLRTNPEGRRRMQFVIGLTSADPSIAEFSAVLSIFLALIFIWNITNKNKHQNHQQVSCEGHSTQVPQTSCIRQT